MELPSLPPDVWGIIATRLELVDVCRASQACSAWRRGLTSAPVWRVLGTRCRVEVAPDVEDVRARVVQQMTRDITVRIVCVFTHRGGRSVNAEHSVVVRPADTVQRLVDAVHKHPGNTQPEPQLFSAFDPTSMGSWREREQRGPPQPSCAWPNTWGLKGETLDAFLKRRICEYGVIDGTTLEQAECTMFD